MPLNSFNNVFKKTHYRIKYNFIKFRTIYEVSSNIEQFYINFAQYDELYEFYKKTILEHNIASHLLMSLNDAEGWENRAGNFYIRTKENGKSFLKICSKTDILNANIIALGGIEFDDLPAHAALLKNLESLIKSDSLANTSISFQPFISRRERYSHILNYSLNDSHIPEYIFLFVRNYIIPNLIHKKDLNTNFPLLTLFSFSAGGREILMIEKALYIILKSKEYELTEEEIKNLFLNINALCISYACKFTSDNSPKFTKIIIYGIEDSGVLLPESLAINYLDKYIYTISTNPYTIFNNKINHEESNEFLIILGKDTIIKYMNGKKPNEKGHALPNYIETMNNCLTTPILYSIQGFLLNKFVNFPHAKIINWQEKILEYPPKSNHHNIT